MGYLFKRANCLSLLHCAQVESVTILGGLLFLVHFFPIVEIHINRFNSLPKEIARTLFVPFQTAVFAHKLVIYFQKGKCYCFSQHYGVHKLSTVHNTIWLFICKLLIDYSILESGE